MKLLLTKLYQRSAYSFYSCLKGDHELYGAEELAPFLRRWPGLFKVRGMRTLSAVHSPEQDASRFVDDVIAICRRHAVEGVYTTGTFHTLALSRAREEIEAATGARVLVDGAETIELLSDKWRFHLLAQELGLSTPRTALVETPLEPAQAAEKAGIQGPYLIKSRRGSGGMGFRLVNRDGSPSRPLGPRRKPGPYDPEPSHMVQQWVQGTIYGANCLALSGEVLAAYTQKTLVISHDTWGYGVVNQATMEEELLSCIKDIVRRTSYTGLANFDFIRDRDGRFHILEANPRPWVTLQLGIDAGLDLPSMFLDMFLKGNRPDTSSFEPGVVSLQLMPECLTSWLRAGPGLRGKWRRLVSTFRTPPGCRRFIHSGPGLNNLRYMSGMALNMMF